MSRFDKQATTLDEQIALLQSRGLQIPDRDRARHYLAHISYYRLSAYTRPFYLPNTSDHSFIAGTTFENVLTLYVFDRELRLLLLDAIERLEVALRAQMTNILAQHYGPHGYLDPAIFDSRYRHSWLLDKLKEEGEAREVETFLVHYRAKYTAAPPQPPVWMALELLTFKAVSLLFSHLRHTADIQPICQHLGWPHTVLCSWFRSLSDLRNLCAHHSRVWNREFGSFPVIPRKPSALWPLIPKSIVIGTDPERIVQPQRRLYMQVVVMVSLLRIVNPDSRWTERLIQLIDRYPQIPQSAMGFPSGWEQEALWRPAIQQARGLLL